MGNSSSKSKRKTAGGEFADLEKRPALVAIKNRIAAILLLAPLSIDEQSVRVLLGDPQPLPTLRAVAFVFGRERNTVQTSWRGGGMPGTNGAYDPVAILCWLLRRERNRNNAPTSNGYRDDDDRRELAEIELASARLDLSIKQSRAERVAGEFINLELARSDAATALNIIRDEIMSIGRKLMPFCPEGHAIEFREEADRMCERVLDVAADRLEQEFCNQVERQHEATSSTRSSARDL